MINISHNADLSLQETLHFGVFVNLLCESAKKYLLVQNLDGILLIVLHILGEIDVAEPTRANPLGSDELPDSAADFVTARAHHRIIN